MDQISRKHELEGLLRDPDFLRIIDLLAKEVMRFWSIPYQAGRGFVLSAIGEPETLARIYEAWVVARGTGELGLAKVIIRRRVIDLLRKDARPCNHGSLLPMTGAAETERPLGPFQELVERNPRAQLELQQIIQLVRGALACFAAQGPAQRRQAQLLHRYALDEVSYAELSVELESSEGALRVRVHKAMLALRRHIQECHPELEGLLEHDRRSPRVGSRRVRSERGAAERDASRHKLV